MTNGKENMNVAFSTSFRETRRICREGRRRKAASANKVASSRTRLSQNVQGEWMRDCEKRDNCDSLMECDGCASRYCHTLLCLGLTALPREIRSAVVRPVFSCCPGSLPFSHLCIFLLVFRNVHATKATRETAAPSGSHGAGSKKVVASSATRAVSPVPMDTLLEEETTNPISLQRECVAYRQKASGDPTSHWLFRSQLPAKWCYVHRHSCHDSRGAGS